MDELDEWQRLGDELAALRRQLTGADSPRKPHDPVRPALEELMVRLDLAEYLQLRNSKLMEMQPYPAVPWTIRILDAVTGSQLLEAKPRVLACMSNLVEDMLQCGLLDHQEELQLPVCLSLEDADTGAVLHELVAIGSQHEPVAELSFSHTCNLLKAASWLRCSALESSLVHGLEASRDEHPEAAAMLFDLARLVGNEQLRRSCARWCLGNQMCASPPLDGAPSGILAAAASEPEVFRELFAAWSSSHLPGSASAARRTGLWQLPGAFSAEAMAQLMVLCGSASHHAGQDLLFAGSEAAVWRQPHSSSAAAAPDCSQTQAGAQLCPEAQMVAAAGLTVLMQLVCAKMCAHFLVLGDREARAAGVLTPAPLQGSSSVRDGSAWQDVDAGERKLRLLLQPMRYDGALCLSLVYSDRDPRSDHTPTPQNLLVQVWSCGACSGSAADPQEVPSASRQASAAAHSPTASSSSATSNGASAPLQASTGAEGSVDLPRWRGTWTLRHYQGESTRLVLGQMQDFAGSEVKVCVFAEPAWDA